MRSILVLPLLIAVLAPVLLPSPSAGEEPSGEVGVKTPPIGMLWSPASGTGNRADRWARYGVGVFGPETFGLEWAPDRYKDRATAFLPESIAEARKTLTDLQKRNPKLIPCVEIYFFEADEGAYPPDSPWWFRDEKGKKVQFWKGCYNMDVANPDYIEHVVRRIAAIHDAFEGKAGIFLDNLRYDDRDKSAWTSLLAKVRESCGEIPIMVNAGWDSTDLEWIAPQINGILYEDSVHHTPDKDTEAFYGRIQRDGQLCREPRIGLNESFGKRKEAESAMRELVRTLVYTDLFFLHADSTYGHRHDWRPEWDAPLGPPEAPAAIPEPGKLARRPYAGGLVLWLPESAEAPVTVPLDSPMRPAGAKAEVREITLQPNRGAILLKPR